MTTDRAPDLSVLIPTYHREEYIALAVRSVLRESPLRVEVIVADDSPEGSAAAVVSAIADDRVRYVHRTKPTGGRPAIVRNEMLEASSGQFLYFLDDDDTASIETLGLMVARLRATGAGVGIGAVVPHGPSTSKVVAEEREHYQRVRSVFPTVRSKYELAARLLFRSSLICCSACIIRREAFIAVGGFDPGIPLYEDVEMYLRALRRFDFEYVDEELLQRRTGEPSLLQDLRDTVKIQQSYALMHAAYRSQFGALELMALRLYARVFIARVP